MDNVMLQQTAVKYWQNTGKQKELGLEPTELGLQPKDLGLHPTHIGLRAGL
jgi:hypothetical protein